MNENLDNSFSIPNLLQLFGRKPLVLCVEDNLMNAELIGQFLMAYCEMHYSKDASDALLKVHSSRYDLILMDINLGPGMNGLELFEKIREIPQYATIPIAAITGFLGPEEKDNTLAQGFGYYLSKPFKREELLGLVQEILIKLIYRDPGMHPSVPINAP